jgi:hypothetical protein
MSGNDGIVAWGRAVDGGLLSHFVAGLPASGLTALGGLTGSYSLMSGTPVTDSSDTTIGTLNSATLTVDFGPGSVGVNMAWTINGSPLNANLSGSMSGPSGFASGGCGLSCSVSADILLFGANAVRAGMTYSITDFTSSFGQAIGAAAFTQTGLTTTPAR